MQASDPILVPVRVAKPRPTLSPDQFLGLYTEEIAMTFRVITDFVQANNLPILDRLDLEAFEEVVLHNTDLRRCRHRHRG